MSTHSTNGPILATDLDLNQWKRIFDNCGLLCGICMNDKEPTRAMQPIVKFKESIDCKPLFQVRDDCEIRTYMRNKRMKSWFVSNSYFDGGLDLSLFGAGANMAYSKDYSTNKETQTKYSTCAYHFRRVIMKLDLKYLELNQSFINDIDCVLRNYSEYKEKTKDFSKVDSDDHKKTMSRIHNDLEQVFSTYGHVYPKEVTLGGHLFLTEEHSIYSSSNEDTIRKSGEIRFKSIFSKLIEIHAKSGSSYTSEHEHSYEKLSTTLEAVGGNTLYASDPEQWMKTIADPMLWRIIEQKDYKPIMDLLNEQQRAIIEGWFVLFIENKFSCYFRMLIEIHLTWFIAKIDSAKLRMNRMVDEIFREGTK
ncbi:unnamed protein product [Rotaria socialis]|uniref:MACPF-like domain-containing protein n=1 Tax=Rotaria socialis TaxID=392032 RepID=A0A820PRG6_9BILA|nr:unnamed protein product [Rotaria socialis]CAF3513877.1 unnamed protein product [Rotaria socialis]CAF4410404.1 unnamed protein product [Rotaria socialis]CAF4438405.1 unnamed protein product [Rotaria socialis]CAF4805125.1 unnamed protein product [Rotaria socialis]